MSLRVIGGLYGGRKLDAPVGRTTHPMGERIRNALFNSLAGSITDSTVLDAFAGTGALGIEALSRGAHRATFIEKDSIAHKCIQNNIQSLNIVNAQVVRATISSWLNTYDGEPFDVIFADPPYHDTQFPVIKRLTSLLRNDGLFVLGWPENQPVPLLESMTNIFNRQYAGARILIYKKV